MFLLIKNQLVSNKKNGSINDHSNLRSIVNYKNSNGS